MLFNAPEFLLLFLPATLAGYFLLRLFHSPSFVMMIWLFSASLFFYGWWNPAYLPLLLGSIIVNYALGRRLLSKTTSHQRHLLTLSVILNLGFLGYFKYAGFLVSSTGAITGHHFDVPDIVLPLAISFFTFQQIAFLVDCYKKKLEKPPTFLNFAVFVSFFPQLIAGPIVHHREMMPQFETKTGRHPNTTDIAAGISLIAIGLFKKVVLADTLDGYATPLFDSAAQGQPLIAAEAWLAVLAYTFQIYFDFSGYCDIAMGAARLFGIRLPVNFFSPYKATSLIDFWRRWHITLSRFLRDYLYIPMGGNRKGISRRYSNLMITMLLGGLWHGAGWTFVIWGGLHGLYLMVNHFWRQFGFPISNYLAGTITFIAVTLAWIFFRAENTETAFSILHSMADFGSLYTGENPLYARFDKQDANLALPILVISGLICFFAPNSIDIMRKIRPVIRSTNGHRLQKRFPVLVWRPNFIWGCITGTILAIGLFYSIYEPSQVFLYFQF